MAEQLPSSDMERSILAMNPLQLSLLVAIPFVLLFSLINFSLQLYSLGQIEFTMVATLLALYVWVKKADVPVWQKNLFVMHPAILFALLFLQGGFSQIGFIWSFGFPFIACLSAGSRIGLIWVILYALAVAILSTVMGDMAWQKLLYIGLAYCAFSLLAIYTVLWREKYEASGEHRLFDTANRLKKKEHLLTDSRISHRSLLDALPYALAVHSEERWIYCNLAAVCLMGEDSVDDVVGTSIFDYIPPEDHEHIKARIARMKKSGRAAPNSDERLLRKDGTLLPVRIQSCPVKHEGKHAFMLTAEEIGRQDSHGQEQLTEQLEQSQRLESLGVLAGGIAHDFNNLLTAILGNAELAKGKLADQAAVTGHLDNIVGSCDHAAELCKQMLAYAGKGSYEVEVLNLNTMVKSMGKLIRASVSSHIALKIKLDQDLPGIEGDLAQIQQLVLNFIVNSAEAIGTDSGEIKVSSGVRNMKRKQLDTLYNGSELSAGQYVVIEVRDNGCGMSKEMQEKIFDPFFTTKKTGSGLGLSAVLGIVRGHHGALQLFSSPGKGTAFRVYLPSTEQAFKEIAVTTVEVESWQGDGRVLVVDDDLRVRNVARAYVEKLNFDVVTAEDGKEGIAVFKKHHHNLAAVLLDMTMPVMGGVDAMQGMRAIDSSIPIVIVSGYSEIEAGALITGDRPDAFLQKPFKAKDLKTTLYEVITSHEHS